MKHVRIGGKTGAFVKLLQSGDGQAYLMSLRSGETSSEEPDNEHPHSEQWLFVISGVGQIAIGKARSRLRFVSLRSGSLLLVEKGELHQVQNTGRRNLVTLNLYIPPAYDKRGNPNED